MRKKSGKIIEFVFNEFVRLQQSYLDGTYSEVTTPEDHFCTISAPERGRYIIGSAAQRKLFELAADIIEDDADLCGRVQNGDLVQVMKDEFVLFFMDNRDAKPSDFIAACIEKIKQQKIISIEYFIPCILPRYKGLKNFNIGPVKFYKKEAFFKEFENEIEESKFLGIDKFKEHYKLQNWVAVLRVNNFTEELAKERAYLMVRVAIASIKMSLQLSDAKWLGTDKQNMPDRRGYGFYRRFSSDQVGKVQPSASWQSVFNSSNESVQHLFSQHFKDSFDLVGGLISLAIDQGKWGFLIKKLITAFLWLDVGNSHVSDAERVIAFANCLETLFVTSEKGIKDQIVRRSNKILDYAGENVGLNKKVEEFYKARCGLVHGNTMPLEAELREAVSMGKYFTDHCMVGMLFFSSWLANKHLLEKTPLHKQTFRGAGSFEKALDTELDQFIAIQPKNTV